MKHNIVFIILAVLCVFLARLLSIRWFDLVIIISVALPAGYALKFFLKKFSPSYRAKLEKLKDKTSQEYKSQIRFHYFWHGGVLAVATAIFLFINMFFGETEKKLTIEGVLFLALPIIVLVFLIRYFVGERSKGVLFGGILKPIIILRLVFVIVIFYILVLGSMTDVVQTIIPKEKLNSITTFDQCVKAGNPIMESFPEQCRTQDGVLFVNWQGAGLFCVQVITPARNPQTGETRDFPTPCDVPKGWEITQSH